MKVITPPNAVVLKPGNIEGFAPLGDLLAGETPETSGFSLVCAFGPAIRIFAIGRHEILEMVDGQRRTLAEVGHVGAHIVDPDRPGIALVFRSTSEKEDVRLDALGVKDARRQAQDGVEIHGFEQSFPYCFPGPAFE